MNNSYSGSAQESTSPKKTQQATNPDSVTEPVISAVIITRHRPKPLENCLHTLEPFRERGLEVIIVDNSDDKLTEQVASNFSWTIYLRVPHSKNFQTATRNRGLKMARAPIVAYLDDDVTVKPTWFDACLEGYRQNGTDNIGGVGGRILDPEVEGRDYYRVAPICTITPNGGLTDNLECDPGKIITVQHLRGCNYSIRKEAALAAGGFDERLLGYGFEDLDLLLRMQRRGYKLLFHPQMEVYHHLVPRENIDRYDKGFQGRLHHCRNLTYSYLKSVPATGWRFIFLGDTGLLALLRRPSGTILRYVISGFCGKASGFWRYVAWRLRGRP